MPQIPEKVETVFVNLIEMYQKSNLVCCKDGSKYAIPLTRWTLNSVLPADISVF